MPPLYQCNPNGTIIAYYGPGGPVVIPDIINGVTVTAIGDNVFKGLDITSVTMPDTVVSIGTCAFSDCVKLTKAELSGNLQTLGDNAFSNSGIAEIRIPVSVDVLPDNLFNGCPDLTDVTLHEKLLKIGKSAFYGCSSLKSVLLPDPLTLNNAASADVVLPPALTLLDDFAFFGCGNLRRMVCLSRTVIFGKDVFSFPMEGLGLAIWGYPESTAQFYVDNIKQNNKSINIQFHPGFLVTFDPNGGPAVPRQFVSVCLDLPNPGIIIKPSGPVKAGYELDGWYTVSTMPNKWDFANDKVTADITLRAKWLKLYKISAVASPASYGIVYGAGIIAETRNCTLTAMMKAGCKFVGWREGEFLTGKSSGGKIVWTLPEYSFTVNGNRLLTAVFEKNLITRI